MQWLKPMPLVGHFITLEVLSLHHIDELKHAVLDGESWKLWYANVPSPEQMHSYVERAIIEAKNGNSAFAVRCNSSHKIVGTTRFYNVDAQHKRALLGYTWYAKAVRRSPVNTECKLLMLKYLFDTHNAIAVEFRTHFFNQQSRKAIARLGAKQDGILRSHQITSDGSIRDTVVYSIIASEWPAVKNHLLNKLKYT
ncbi:GNAT family N-acetyltransferase [Pseudoalteromonas sp. SG41-1]|uniref:GNAT family N-acetyltransferase n=1 Tax=Pseudoalteromonas TaxID=53246 RepID=UPI00160038F1|nr:GNAT family protein [Pseudoalteromonas sp. SG41-1]MBB1504263.1 GNAT family N-acetyltransferase [Pseudoalteromonas sp. SG41-1]|tara:strand:- start:106 stop:693 length:588 start_codon:yes stop_codon:yes gene_type:complete